MNYNISQNDRNKLFELKLQNHLEQTRLKIWNRDEIIYLFGENIKYISHMINVNNIFICFQTKITDNSVSVSDFINFSNCVNYISSFHNTIAIGIYISNKSLCNPCKIQLENENNKYTHSSPLSYFYNISELNENVLLSRIHNFLHQTFSIYMYDTDGDCIMGYTY